ncbi:MAG: hypothetical protein WAW39_11005 [Prosthecobacter sp.]|uniref:hypothetical protein n=1 Tax=Prosthecobacter sp. TaxID=1965333 RepID=UPI003BAFAA1C
MKMLLFTLLLLTSAAQAEQWLVNGRTYNGTFHKFSVDHTKVYVTSDRDNYKGSWIKVTALDPATRVRLRVATPQEQAAVQAQREQKRQLEAQASAQAEQNRQLDIQALAQAQTEQRRLMQAQSQTSANAGYAASVAQHQVNMQHVEDARRMAAAYRRSYSPVYSVPRYSQYYYPRTGYRNYSSYGCIPHAHVNQFHIPHVYSSGGVHVVQPILLWNR